MVVSYACVSVLPIIANEALFKSFPRSASFNRKRLINARKFDRKFHTVVGGVLRVACGMHNRRTVSYNLPYDVRIVEGNFFVTLTTNR